MNNHIIARGWEEEIKGRVARIAAKLAAQGIDALLVSSNVNLYYTSSRVFAGYTYIAADGSVRYFVRRPVGLTGDGVSYIRKPEQIAEMLGTVPGVLALELDSCSVSEADRLKNAFAGSTIANGSAVLRSVRSVKTEFEIELLKESGVHHEAAYSHIKESYKEGMTDVELQIEMERVLRLEGCLGQFRIAGQSMELFMGNLLVGDNADNASPYDFAMGGGGCSLSLPVGANRTVIKPGNSVMVDMCGNFNGYMTDMTRSFRVGDVGELAEKAHQVSIEINHRLAVEGKTGVAAKALYDLAASMAEEAGLADYFMGHNQKAGFMGHGVGIEVNEMPVLAPRSRDILEAGNVIALEPKFVIPGVGAVGVENTYVVRDSGLECITNFPEELAEL